MYDLTFHLVDAVLTGVDLTGAELTGVLSASGVLQKADLRVQQPVLATSAEFQFAQIYMCACIDENYPSKGQTIAVGDSIFIDPLTKTKWTAKFKSGKLAGGILVKGQVNGKNEINPTIAKVASVTDATINDTTVTSAELIITFEKIWDPDKNELATNIKKFTKTIFNVG